MRIHEIIPATRTTPYKIARQLVAAARKTYVEKDVPRAVDMGVGRFVDQLRKAAREEMKRMSMRQIETPNKGV